MTVTEYYRRAVWLPLWLPLLFVPVYLMQYGANLEMLVFPIGKGINLGALALLLLGSLAWGGLPYLLMLAAHVRLFRRGTAGQWSRFYWTAPLRMLPFLLGFLCLAALIDRIPATFPTAGDSDTPLAFGISKVFFYVVTFTGIATITLGYLYVVLIQALRALLQSRGTLHPDPSITV